MSVDSFILSPQKLDSLVGAEVARVLSIAIFALTVYDYAITIDDEIFYFWTGPFSISHCLFFFNRYVPASIILLAIIAFTAILITRVWFLFPGEKVIQFGLLFSFIISLSISFIFVYVSADQLTVLPAEGILVPGCLAHRPSSFWRIYLPSLVLHTGLYILTAYQAVTNRDCWKQANLRKQLLRDGGIFYLIVLCMSSDPSSLPHLYNVGRSSTLGSVGLTSIGSFLTQFPIINTPAVFSPIVLATTSIATNRVMFSLRAITTNVGSSFEWLPMENPSLSVILDRHPETPYAAKSRIPTFDDEERGGGVRRIFMRVGK
ncbi:hypothetical protein BDZ97DRAFT_2054495 [Flammula alnicola]|nr:hypothetical protein BDZ97DRAFT_2054495 [Flammula alnicola]